MSDAPPPRKTQGIRKITKREALIFCFIRDFIDDNQMPPTQQDIAEKMGFSSPNSVTDHLASLVRKGYIEKLPHKARGIKITEVGARHTNSHSHGHGHTNAQRATASLATLPWPAMRAEE